MPELFQKTGSALSPPRPRQISTVGLMSGGNFCPWSRKSLMSGSGGVSMGTIRPEASTRHNSMVQMGPPKVPMAASTEPSAVLRKSRRATALSRKGRAAKTITSSVSPATSQNSVWPSASSCCFSASERPSAVFSKMLAGSRVKMPLAVMPLSSAWTVAGSVTASRASSAYIRIYWCIAIPLPAGAGRTCFRPVKFFLPILRPLVHVPLRIWAVSYIHAHV